MKDNSKGYLFLFLNLFIIKIYIMGAPPVGYPLPRDLTSIIAKLRSDVLIKEAALNLLPHWHDLHAVYEAELTEINRQLTILTAIN